MARAARAVGVERPAVGGGLPLGLRELVGLAGAGRPQRLEERSVGLLGRVREAATEPAEEDRRPAFDERERVAPEPEGETEAEVGGEGGVRRLARQVRRHVRDADADRVERLVERRGLRVDSPEQRLGVRDRRRSGEDGERRELARQPPEDAAPDRAGQQAEQAAQRRVGDPVDRLRVVGIAVEDAAERGRVQSAGRRRAAAPAWPGLARARLASFQPLDAEVSSSEYASAARRTSGLGRREQRGRRRRSGRSPRR